MTNNEFFYWIQGYFEIAGLGVYGHGILNKDQCECIFNHTKLVQKDRSENLGKIIALIEAMIEGHLSFDKGTLKIADIVSMQFKHVIDLQYGEKLKNLKKIHGGPDEMMC